MTSPSVASHHQAELNTAIRALSKRHPVLKQAAKTYGMPKSRRLPTGFATLARIIVDQQISTKAAASIWKKLQSNVGRVSAVNIAAARGSQLKSAGLSASKIKTLRGLAYALENKVFTFQSLHRLSDEDVKATLTALWGIGDWTADIYLMFGMGRPDIWPSGDLALRTGWQRITESTARMDAETLTQEAEAWRPHRSAAAVLLWHCLK